MTASLRRLLRPRGVLAGVLLTLLVLAGAVGSARPAAADSGAATCMGNGGIYVYVFNQGSEIAEGCSSGSNAYQRVSSVAGRTQATSSGFICKIGGVPDGACEVDSSTQVYWSFWWWRNGSWTYATAGGGYAGVAGTAEAWNYSTGQAPPVSPPDPAVAQPEPAPATEQPAAAQPDSGSGQDSGQAGGQAAGTTPSQGSGPTAAGATTSGGQTTASTDPSSASQSPESSSSSGTPSAQGSADASSSASSSVLASSTPVARPSAGGGGPWATVGTLSALAVGGAGYGLWTWRKHRRPGDPMISPDPTTTFDPPTLPEPE